MRKLPAGVSTIFLQFRHPTQFEEGTNATVPQKQPIQFADAKAADEIATSTPQQRVKAGIKRLEAQAERINQLSAEIEAAIWELKAIATQINQDNRSLQKKRGNAKLIEICKYRSAKIPNIYQKPCGRFVLVLRPLGISKAEREATLLAKKLRQWTKRKRRVQCRRKD